MYKGSHGETFELYEEIFEALMQKNVDAVVQWLHAALIISDSMCAVVRLVLFNADCSRLHTTPALDTNVRDAWRACVQRGARKQAETALRIANEDSDRRNKLTRFKRHTLAVLARTHQSSGA